jgi:glucosamine--fructose-6-phosphate aminotransferase (isomerizing)
MTFMAEEIAECPQAAARLLAGSAAEAIARELRGRDFSFVVVCGRGSSGHAGVYLRYLIETHLTYVVSASAPSIVTSYRKAPHVAGALFVVISQSGRSPDLVAATQAAREGGALTLAIRCATACTPRYVADGPAVAHVEGHIVFAPTQP